MKTNSEWKWVVELSDWTDDGLEYEADEKHQPVIGARSQSE